MESTSIFTYPLHLASSINQLDADLKASPLNSNKNTDLDNLELSVLGKINPAALLTSLMMLYGVPFINWKSTEVKLEGNHVPGAGVD
ncbi:MAG: hypothetical protein IPJ20_18915 [Flammeovirgaceae bacterium]|nr:hypothetical protein [Flammeovirgaceae bacterium]